MTRQILGLIMLVGIPILTYFKLYLYALIMIGILLLYVFLEVR